jgi:hypothetical protein
VSGVGVVGAGGGACCVVSVRSASRAWSRPIPLARIHCVSAVVVASTAARVVSEYIRHVKQMSF